MSFSSLMIPVNKEDTASVGTWQTDKNVLEKMFFHVEQCEY